MKISRIFLQIALADFLRFIVSSFRMQNMRYYQLKRYRYLQFLREGKKQRLFLDKGVGRGLLSWPSDVMAYLLTHTFGKRIKREKMLTMIVNNLDFYKGFKPSKLKF
jgi:hypothetical protein